MRAAPKTRNPPPVMTDAKTTVAAPSSASSASAGSGANHVPTVSAASVGEDAQTVPLATAGCGSVTKELLDAKRDEFVRLRRAWAKRVGEVDEALEYCDIGPLEIARGVTSAMLHKIPDAWLVGLDVALNDDGVLELMDVEGHEHRKSKSAAFVCLGRYADDHFTPENGLSAEVELPGVYANTTCEPDGVLSMFFPPNQPPQAQNELPFVVVEVDIHNRSVPKIVEVARLYLSEPHVHRVVAFKIFKPRAETATTGNIRKAAIAIEFERDGEFQQGQPANIRVVQEVSFGSAVLDSSVLENLSQVPSRTSPAGLIRAIAPSPLEAAAIRVGDVVATFPRGRHPSWWISCHAWQIH